MLTRIYRFEIIKEVARTNQSVVFEAKDPLDGSIVLLYEWAPNPAQFDAAADRFSQISPSLPGVEAFTSDTLFYFSAPNRAIADAALGTLQAQQLFTGPWYVSAQPPPPPKPAPAP